MVSSSHSLSKTVRVKYCFYITIQMMAFDRLKGNKIILQGQNSFGKGKVCFTISVFLFIRHEKFLGILPLEPNQKV